MTQLKSEVLQGTLDLLVLKTLEQSANAWLGLSRRIQQVSEEALQLGQGTIYPALLRLEQRGWIAAEWVFRIRNAKPDSIRSQKQAANSSGRKLRVGSA